ncbi:ATP-binding cassette domain-containing protein [Mycoplasma buteonis]|uniref:ATP-binding cassette domain-containing protein n=1 Tax=Mycoplasma buteonis TaxID=171280 RepID=UPI00068CBC2E|nr:ABC transporter ATP-binding protein [Mycoplasma buteonis]
MKMKWNKYYWNAYKVWVPNLIVQILVSALVVSTMWISYFVLNKIQLDNLSGVFVVIGIYVAFGFLTVILESLKQGLFLWTIYGMHLEIRKDLFNELNKVHPKSLRKHSNEELMNLLENDGNMVAQTLLVWNFGTEVIFLLLGLSILYSFIAWQILVVFWVVGIIQVVINTLISIKSTKIAPKINENYNVLYNKTNNVLTNAKQFILANKKELLVSFLSKKLWGFYKTELRLNNWQTTYSSLNKFNYWFFQILTFTISVILFNYNYVNLSVVILTFLHYETFVNYLLSLSRVSDGFMQLKQFGLKITNFFGNLIYKNVLVKTDFTSLKLNLASFGYEEKKVFENFNFEILKGEKIYLQGKSGAGKSTFIKLLLNLENLTSGEIKFNELPYSNELDLSKNIGFVDLETKLLESDNINSIISNYEIHEENDKIRKLKTMFNIDFDSKKNLSEYSTGQYQRLVLANAFYQDKDFYILDEALSNLDEANRNNIFNTLINTDKTLLFVSHHFNQNHITQFNKVIDLNKN